MRRAAMILAFSSAALLILQMPTAAQVPASGIGKEAQITLAQFQRFGPPPEEDFEQPRRRRRDLDGSGDPRFRGGGGGGRRAGSNICITSRGSCDAGFVAPHNTPCRCIIPGFGEKRGAIQ